ncbi:hypothetical protein ISN44_As11g030450 [Arabidopsis suecica]|uniref:Uncharacterized protein n=1 Tax=Arabidopsis suecica TaxID=45249 RepID=A0A8T1ZDH2_ARASU|nr:hypothetical protein ISN44_As11g030450 [Arabidopsis suecica]
MIGDSQESLTMCGVLESYEESQGSNVVEEIPMREFHISQPLMEIIVSKVGEDGVDALKNLLLAGREGKDAVLSKKTLASCLAANNPYAKFVEKNKGLAYESTIGYFQMRCRWKVCHEKRLGGLMDLDDMKRCVVKPPMQRERVGRPRPLMEIIMSKVGEDGVDALKNLLLAGREGKDAVLSNKTLSSVRIDMDPHFMWWSMPHSKYYTFYQKCLDANNPYAKFVEKHKALCYESSIGYFQMRCLWNVSHDKRMVDDMNVCVVQLPFQPGRVGRPSCPRCKRVGHRFNSSLNVIDFFNQHLNLFYQTCIRPFEQMGIPKDMHKTSDQGFLELLRFSSQLPRHNGRVSGYLQIDLPFNCLDLYGGELEKACYGEIPRS